jgi:O-acetyl-ADP-ribose deacetylase
MRLSLHGVTLELTTGDIARQPDVDAVVNAANAELRTGGGVAGALHRGAGPELEAAGRPLAPIRPGEAVVTPAFRLPNRAVIHALGPIYGRDRPSDVLLAEAYRNALRRAEEEGFASVAFPALSTGAFGYPLEEAAEVALGAVLKALPGLASVRLVRFVLYDEAALAVHARVLERLASA